MSHFTKIKTMLKDGITIVKALKQMGFDVSTQKGSIVGYSGTRNADIRVKIGGSYRIGFVKGYNGYEVVADWWTVKQKSKWTKEKFMQMIAQRYVYFKVIEKAEENNWNIVTEEAEKDGSIKMVLEEK